MGVPAFFKWLTLRYPNIVIDAREDIDIGINVTQILSNNYIDTSLPLIDNLYLDMNGIIHPCSHPTDRDSPQSYPEIFNSIFFYVDKIIRIIKPKKLIYMAIDGVAPRAKMNQQRSRRFRAAMEATEKKRQEQILKKEWKNKGLEIEEEEEGNSKGNNTQTFEFDSNTITPGTPFLHILSKALITYIKSRLNNDPNWKELTVIISDAQVPGEGEHKILDFIRTQRTFDAYDPNTSHCIYGADADLIMLGLIMHEPHFYIIRESLNDKAYLKCENCGKQGHTEENCKKSTNVYIPTSFSEICDNNKEQIDEIEFSLIKLPIVREYLQIEFKSMELNFEYDIERIIDDFVFLCFLVGNDFIPNLPSLKIREGAIDALIYLYKKILPSMEGYLTNGKGQINLQRCEILFKNLAMVEDEFFKQEMINKINEENYRKNNSNHNSKKKKTLLEQFRSINQPKPQKNKEEIDIIEIASNIIEREEDNNNNFSIEEIRKNGKKKFNQILKEQLHEQMTQQVDAYKDTVRLGEEGWKDRYYQEKFRISPSSSNFTQFKDKIKKFYIEGICWVFEYYYNGCISWEWFYPFHYAPFASDLTNLSDIEISFKKDHPIYPFEQLLSVLPPYSYKSLPKCLGKIMKDPFSEIADFYPSTIKLDINGQRYPWMGVNLIPFIDERRIRKVVKDCEIKNAFSKEEKELNKFGSNILISANRHSIEYVKGIFSESEIDTFNREVMENDVMEGLIIGNVYQDITKCFIFNKIDNVKRHHSKLLEGVQLDSKKIFMDSMDFYPKTKFKGKTAIDLVRNVLGFTGVEDIDAKVKGEYFDSLTYNNNRAIEYNPEEIALLKKKRYKEGIDDMIRAREIANREYYESKNNNGNNNNNNGNNGNNSNAQLQLTQQRQKELLKFVELAKKKQKEENNRTLSYSDYKSNFNYQMDKKKERSSKGNEKKNYKIENEGIELEENEDEEKKKKRLKEN